MTMSKNPIDNFVYTTADNVKKSAKTVTKAVTESDVIKKAIVSPIDKLLFGGCWSVMVWCLIIGLIISSLFSSYHEIYTNLGYLTGRTVGGLLLFMIPLSRVWHNNTYKKNIFVVVSIITSLLNALFEWGILYLLSLIVCIIIAFQTKKVKFTKK